MPNYLGQDFSLLIKRLSRQLLHRNIFDLKPIKNITVILIQKLETCSLYLYIYVIFLMHFLIYFLNNFMMIIKHQLTFITDHISSNLRHETSFLQDSCNARIRNLDSVCVCFVMKHLGLSVQRLSENERFCEKKERLQITLVMTQFAPSVKGILGYRI